MAERFMATLKKAVQRSQLEHKPVTQVVCQTLRDYRNTPHSTTNRCPADLMFGRKLKTRLPVSSKETQDEDAELRARDEKEKEKMKAYADVKRRAQESSIEVGDWVLVKQEQHCKGDSRFKTPVMKVIAKKGSMITVAGSGRPVTRNVSHFKRHREQRLHNEVDEEWATVEHKGSEEEQTVETRSRPAREVRRPQRLIEEI